MMSCQFVLWVINKMNEVLCPFAKAIWGACCQCDQAQLVDQRTRHVKCNATSVTREQCVELDTMFKNMAYNLKDEDIGETLTYSQLMKVRCGGFIGLQRVLSSEDSNIADLVSSLVEKFSTIEEFPFETILDDMNRFQLRKRRMRQ